MGRVLVIGDIHGSAKGLQQCLDRSGFNKAEDTIISLGDIADGWPEVPQCVDILLSIPNRILIKGNHDQWAYEWLKFGDAKHIWINQGGKATFDAYKDYPEVMMNHRDQFFAKQVNYYVDDQNRGFVHGGFNSKRGLGYEAYHSDYYWDRDLWSLALLQDRLIGSKGFSEVPTHATRFYNHKEVYIGHTSTGSWNAKGNMKECKDPNQILNSYITVPMNRCNVWNMDTGGGFEGKITIMDIDTKEYWQSDFCKELYPNYKGR